MISIIICSRAELISSGLKHNIEETIGVEFEIIQINNSENKYSIFEAYNMGVEKSTYPYLCFMHDDIEYHTQNWGAKIADHFKDETIGAIGIAGSPYAAFMPGSWWGGELVNQFILPVDSPDEEPEITATYKKATDKNEVLLLDGVWLCIRRSLFKHIRFDNINYQGFHFYDVDTCMQVSQWGYKLYSIFDVLIRHYSLANMNANWYENAMIFNKKWKSTLPAACIKLTFTQKCEAELKTLKEYTYNLIYNNYPQKKAYKMALMQLLKFRKGYLYYKTPVHLIKYCIKYMLPA